MNNDFCKNLPILNKKDFESIIHNSNIFNALVQMKSIKECGCIESSLQIQCFERFK